MSEVSPKIRIARTLAASQDVIDYVYGPGVDPLDVHDEWFMPPRELAELILDEDPTIERDLFLAPFAAVELRAHSASPHASGPCRLDWLLKELEKEENVRG